MNAAVEIQKGYKYFGHPKRPKIVLNNIDVFIKEKIIYGLLGASGSGKTTLLSIICGLKKLNSGSIKVFGSMPGFSGVRIGYMPQEISLLKEFTIAETIFYFGRIYDIETRKIIEGYNYLRRLLELPYGTKLVKELSGGQQRCVSFMASVIHEPQLLILDEPTVGLDPLLREKMWSFLIQMSSNSTILITTHYIEEAKQSNCIGLLRNGVLLEEDSPQNILQKLETNSLEDAFLKLCLEQQGNFENSNNSERISSNIQSTSSQTTVNENELTMENFAHQNKIKFTTKRRMKALLYKNLISMTRQHTGLFALLYFPILSLFCFYMGIGAHPKDIKLGIVSNEIRNNSHEDCYNNTAVTINVYDCHLHKISCEFINFLNDEFIDKQFYNNFEDAFTDAKKGNIAGFIYFASNFTESFEKRRDDGKDADNITFESSEIQVFLDQTSQPITYFLETMLRDAYKNFSESLFTQCQLPKKIGNIPIDFMPPIFGSFKNEFTDYVAPGAILSMIFYLGTLITCTVFINDRLEGIWDRTIIAGVTSNEMLISHILTQSCVVILQCLETIILVLYVFGTKNTGSNLTFAGLLILNGICGMTFGIFISIFTGSHSTANFVTTGIFQPLVIFCGVFWPLEGVFWPLKYFAYILPFTLPADSLRNILGRGFNIDHNSVLIGFFMTIGWIIIFSIMSLLKLKRGI